MSAPYNNKHAQHGEKPKDSLLAVRLERARKSAYVKAAYPRPLAVWTLEHLDRAAGYKSKP
jgi:hypothetical protein